MGPVVFQAPYRASVSPETVHLLGFSAWSAHRGEGCTILPFGSLNGKRRHLTVNSHSACCRLTNVLARPILCVHFGGRSLRCDCVGLSPALIPPVEASAAHSRNQTWRFLCTTELSLARHAPWSLCSR